MAARYEYGSNGLRLVPFDERPVHQPVAPDAPIPGRHWYGACDDSYFRVRPDGICEGCGATACPVCGCERWPDTGRCRCPA